MPATTPFLRRFALLLLLLPLVFPLAAQAQAEDWTGRGRFSGEVQDEDGKPIAGAKVYMRMGVESIDPANPGEGPELAETNKYGKWSIGGLASGDWAVLITKEGFVSAAGQVKVGAFGVPPLKTQLARLTDEQRKAMGDARAVSEAAAAIERGNQLLTENQPAQARAAYEEALPKVPAEHQPAVLRGIARTYALENDGDKAVEALEKALAMEGDNVETLTLLVDVLMAIGRHEEAEAYMARLPEGAKVDPTTLLNQGINDYNEGNIEAAYATFDKVVQQNPDMGLPYFYRGLAGLALGKTAEAKADLEKFIALDPNHARVAEAKEFLQSL